MKTYTFLDLLWAGWCGLVFGIALVMASQLLLNRKDKKK